MRADEDRGGGRRAPVDGEEVSLRDTIPIPDCPVCLALMAAGLDRRLVLAHHYGEIDIDCFPPRDREIISAVLAGLEAEG